MCTCGAAHSDGGVECSGVTGVEWQILVAHCLLPLVCIPLTFVLIPDKKMTDMVLDDDEDGHGTPSSAPPSAADKSHPPDKTA
jgi:hypothetical protein